MKLAARVDDLPPEQDRIHVANGTLMLDGTFTEGKSKIERSRLPIAYNPNAPKPERWLRFSGSCYTPRIYPPCRSSSDTASYPATRGSA